MTDPNLTLPHGCGRCPARWSGNSTSHCGACHHTMTSLSAFDKHRRGGQCLTPAAVGLVERQRSGYTVWGLPVDEGAAERFRTLGAVA